MLRKFDIDLCFWIYVQEKDNLHKTAVSWLEMFSYLNSHSNVCRSSSPSSQNSPQTFATSTPLSFSSSPTFDTYKFAPFTTFTSPLSSKFDPQDGHIINLPGYIHWCQHLMKSEPITSLQFILPDDQPVVRLDAATAFNLLGAREQLYSHYLSRASWLESSFRARP